MLFLATWTVSITTGVYKNGSADSYEGSEGNSNNNADDQPAADAGRADGKSASAPVVGRKYRVLPKPPTCSILMVLYGDKGKSPAIPLMPCSSSGSGSFLPGQADDFKVNI